MRLYFDLDQKKLVSGIGAPTPVKRLEFVRGDDTDLELVFLRDSLVAALVGDAPMIVFVIKVSPGAGVVAQAIADVWSQSEDLIYRGSLDLTGETLDALVGTNKSISLLCELTYTDDAGGPNTSQLVTAVIGGDLYRGDELPPDAPGAPENWLQAQLAGAPEKVFPADGDTIPLNDSAAGGAIKKVTWGSVKARLKTYFDGLYVALTGNQTVSGVKTFASVPKSTGTPGGDATEVLNMRQTIVKGLTFTEPTAVHSRVRREYFSKSGTTTGDIGDWGWESYFTGSGAVAFGAGSFVSGRWLALSTGATSGNYSTIYKRVSTGAQDNNAVKFYLTAAKSGSTASPQVDAAMWVGWDDSAGDNGYWLVGWDLSESPNVRIKLKSSSTAATSVIDTGIAVSALTVAWWPTQVTVTLVGGSFNSAILGGTDSRVIVAANPSSQNMQVLYDAAVTVPEIFNSTLTVRLIARAANAKTVSVGGVEVWHTSPFVVPQG